MNCLEQPCGDRAGLGARRPAPWAGLPRILSWSEPHSVLWCPDLGWPRLAARLGFPARYWGQVAVVKAAGGQWQGPLTLQLLQKRIPPKSGSSGQSEVLITREEQVQCVWIDTRADSGRESCSLGSLNHFYEVFLPGFLQTIILIRLVHSPCFVYLRILLCMRIPLLARWILPKGLWVEHPLT